ncbi:D-alanyl-D-alanine carboxypeptidase family protein [Pleurocapsales cyanobacterium LEGE 06147]|nr:D-alanyl-D-alanine carboxypeptidase family protein [Pleurocapsales cyanobacterium LEGE 06147]
MDDIPEAVREKATYKPASRLPFGSIVGGVSLGALALVTSAFLLRPTAPNNNESISNQTVAKPENNTPSNSEPSATAIPDKSPSPTAAPPQQVKKTEEVDRLLGHLPYKEVPASELVAITADGNIKLRRAAAEKFQQMQAAAAAEGIILTPISGFRSISEQDYLFFRVKEQRAQDTSKRAEVSAPPGYSEHHTGYAIDVGDGNVPATNLSPDFENTAAFRWLEQNAARYSFELSFPRDNSQGISYEPWHWRFVGDRHSLETFYRVRNLKQN